MRNSYIGKVTKKINFTPNSFCARREKLEGGQICPPPGHIGLSPKCVKHLDTSTKLFEGVGMDHTNHFSKVNPKFSPGNTLPGANFQISPIENGSRLLGIIETLFWCLSTRLDLLSKS